MNRIMTMLITVVALGGSGFTSTGIWVIDAESKLTIHGSTNVNNFICKIEYCTGTDTLKYAESNSTGQLLFTRGRMVVPVRSFDCGAKPISKDFWKTLKAEAFPNLEINFISLEDLSLQNKRNIKGLVDITLAGITTRYDICYQVSLNENGTIYLTGVHAVNFTDFELKAPEKLKGLIKVREALKVQFYLVLKEI